MPLKDKCPTCGDLKDKRAHQCSNCRFKYNHPRETGRWGLSANGYLEKRINGVHWLQHRYVMTKHLRRELLPNEHVHHKDGDKTNNDISNLELMVDVDHHRQHMTPKRAKYISRLGHAARWGGENSYF